MAVKVSSVRKLEAASCESSDIGSSITKKGGQLYSRSSLLVLPNVVVAHRFPTKVVNPSRSEEFMNGRVGIDVLEEARISMKTSGSRSLPGFSKCMSETQ